MNILTESLAMALSPTHWLIILVIVVLLFGGSKIPELMKGVGQGMGEFKKGMDESRKEADQKANKEEDSKPA